MSGLNRWFSPSARYWYCPPGGSWVWTIGRCGGQARSWRALTSLDTTSIPMPPIRVGVQVKYSSTKSRLRPIASNTCAPW